MRLAGHGWILLVIAVGACATPGRGGAAAADGALSERAARDTAPAEAEPFAPGTISDAREQWRLTFTPDGDTAYFAVSDGFFPATRQATIHRSHRTADGWSLPEVAPFSGRFSDMDPFITPDGRRLFFSSIRPAGGDLDVWVVERTADGWSEPARVGPDVNSSGDELYPSVSRDGTLYVASGPTRPRPGEHFDIYRAARRGGGFAPRERLGDAINTLPVAGGGIVDAWEFNPEISADGTVLVFTSLRPGGHGLGDLYVSRLEGGAWTPARNLGPRVNTAADEYHPTLSRDGRTLYFVRRGPRPGDFFRIATRGLPGF